MIVTIVVCPNASPYLKSLRKITHSIWAGCIYRNVRDQSYNSKTFCSVFMKLGNIVKVWVLTIDNLDYGRHRVPILKSSM